MSEPSTTSYSIVKIDQNDNNIEADVLINDQHDMFKGHFPGNPIVPGVLNIEIIHNIINQAIGKHKIGKIKQLKFLKPVVPGEKNNLHYSIDLTSKSENETTIQVKGTNGSDTHLKALILIQPD